MGAKMEIVGLSDVMLDFDHMEKTADNALLDAALDAGAKVLSAPIEKRAPRAIEHRGPNKSERGRTIGNRKIVRDSRWRSGLHMADTIKASKKKGKNLKRYCYVGPDEGANVSDNKTPHFYWYFHEFGTSKLPARPFMGPGYDEAEAAVEKIMDDILLKGVGL